MFDAQKEKRLEKILNAHEGYVTSLADLTADKEPSLLFIY